MTDDDFIRPPGTTFAARELLSQIGLPQTESRRSLEIARKRIVSASGDDRAFGFNAMWAFATLGNTAVAAEYASAIEKYVEENELPEALAVHYGNVANTWREVSGTPFSLTDAMAAMGNHQDDAVVDDPQEPAVNAHVVIQRIGDPQSAEGKSLSTRYARIIGRPLPKKGVLPEEGVISAAITRDFPWAARTGEIVERSFSLIRDTHSDRSFTKPLIFVGEPGTGKTSLAMFVARLLGRYCVRLPAAGTNDSGTLASTPRGWSNFRASLPVQAVLDSRSCDPCVIVDEVDKSSRVGSQNGSVQGALLGMLDKPENYYDTALMAEADLSHVLFMATANSIETLETALLDRFTIVPVPRPKVEHFDTILGGLRAEMAGKLRVRAETLPYLDSDEYGAIKDFFLETRGSLRKLSTAYEIALKSALTRQKAMTLM